MLILETVGLEFRISLENLFYCFIFLSAPGLVKIEILTSHPLTVTGEACLEFWHLASGASSGATLRALLKSSSGQVEIWASAPLPRDAWRQVSVPLNITELGIQVKCSTLLGMNCSKDGLKRTCYSINFFLGYI